MKSKGKCTSGTIRRRRTDTQFTGSLQPSDVDHYNCLLTGPQLQFSIPCPPPPNDNTVNPSYIIWFIVEVQQKHDLKDFLFAQSHTEKLSFGSLFQCMSYAVPVPCKITPQLFRLITPACCCLVAKSCPTLQKSIDSTCQVLLSMEFPRQEYWSGLPFPSLRDLSHIGIESTSPTWQVDS